MKQINPAIGKFLYGITFLVLIPVGLWLWAKYTQPLMPFSITESKTAGWILIIAGGSLMVWAMFALNKFGKGLPMNAYPPSQFVTQGPYRLFRHPIYFGFGMLMLGYFLFTGSSSGLWLVSPLTILGMVALVLGYEEIDLEKRFPNQQIRTALDLPANHSDSPEFRDRFASVLWIVSLLMLGNFLILNWNNASPQVSIWPQGIFTISQTPILVLLSILFLVAPPFFVRRKDVLRQWVVTGIISLSCTVFIALLYPDFGTLLHIDSVFSSTPLFLLFISLHTMFKHSWQIAVLFTIVASVQAIIQLIYWPSPVAYFAYSTLIFLVSINHNMIWSFLRNSVEIICNSWKEWMFGKVRVINHGFYVGFGAFFGILLAGILAGKEYAFAILVFSFLVTLFAALWAQIIEGSEKLKRPFGYYGGIVGILFGSLVVWTMGYNAWVIIGVVSVVMPWVQAIGRLRCLINGCCHGRITNNPSIGIRYFHPRSRVCNISALKGEMIHPTQLYSILWLTLVGIVLITLWFRDSPYPFIFGLYLILTSHGRFVEEAYRGETQTPILKGLRLYQWTSIFSMTFGIIMTAWPSTTVATNPGFNFESLLVASIGGFFIFFAMGVDFPYSNARFSRLA